MPVDIKVYNIKFYNQYNNGVTFGSNLTDYTPNLVGSVMEKIKLECDISVRSYYHVIDSNRLSYEIVSATVYKFIKDFTQDGFSIGDTLHLKDVPLTTTETPTVTYIDSNYMELTYLGAPTINYDTDEYIIENSTRPTALIYKPNLIGNDEVFNYISKVSGNDIGYYLAGMTPAYYQSMNVLGNYKDFDTGAVTVILDTISGSYEYNHKLTHEFIIAPFYIEGWDTYLESNIMPPLYLGLNSLKYALNADFRTSLSNPSSSKMGKYDSMLGSVAWFNENFNGFTNLYEIESISYEDASSGLSADGLLVTAKTKITTVINKLTGTFSSTDNIGFYVAYIPDEDEYKDTPTDLKENFLYDNYLTKAGDTTPIALGGVLRSISSDLTTTTQVTLTTEVEYTTAQQITLGNDSKYIISVGIDDHTLTSGNSNRVLLLADYNDYDLTADISDLMGIESLALKQFEDAYAGTLWTSLTAWNEDNINLVYDFWLDLDKQAFLNSLDFCLIAYNDATEESFELDKYTFALGSTIVGGSQIFNINTNRGYHLSEDNFNIVKLVNLPLVGTKQHYYLEIGQKISWQDWIANLDVDLSFFNTALPSNNQNLKSSNYDSWGIRFALKANVYGVSDLGTSGNTDYMLLSPYNKVFDYELPTLWEATIETFEPTTMTNLNGAVLEGQDTLFRTTWTDTSGAVTSIYGLTVEHGIQNTGDLGYNTDISSTLFSVPTNNKLGEMSTLTLSSGNVISECTIDGTLIDSPQDLTAKLLHKTPGVSTDAKLTESGIVKITEIGIEKIIE